jgi:hypothetical protein
MNLGNDDDDWVRRNIISHGVAVIVTFYATLMAVRASYAKGVARSNGTYYSPIRDIWGIQGKPCTKADFDDLRRKNPPTFMQRHDPMKTRKQLLLGEWTLTINGAVPTDNVAVDCSKTSRNSHTNTEAKEYIWPTDVCGSPDFDAQIAHLVPASPINASMYSDVARWVFAVEDSQDSVADMKIVQKLIHGAKRDPKKRKQAAKYRSAKDAKERNKRLDCTGLKHMASNKIRLRNQAEFFDQKPCLLIVPVLTVDEMKAWNGEGYNAVVIAGEYDSTNAAEVYKSIGLREGVVKDATRSEIEIARTSLEAVVLGLSYSLFHRSQKVEVGLSKQALERLDELRKRPSAIDLSGIIVPKRSDLSGVRVARVTFAHHNSTKGHPAPDPLLLAVKSSINWSWRNKQKLLAAGERPDEDEEDVQQEELDCEWFFDYVQQSTLENVAIGLHQPTCCLRSVPVCN